MPTTVNPKLKIMKTKRSTATKRSIPSTNLTGLTSLHITRNMSNLIYLLQTSEQVSYLSRPSKYYKHEWAPNRGQFNLFNGQLVCVTKTNPTPKYTKITQKTNDQNSTTNTPSHPTRLPGNSLPLFRTFK